MLGQFGTTVSYSLGLGLGLGIGLEVRVGAILDQQSVIVFVLLGVCFNLPFDFFLKNPLIMALRLEFDDNLLVLNLFSLWFRDRGATLRLGGHH